MDCRVKPGNDELKYDAPVAPHIWIARFSTASAASRTASDMVGCEWSVRAMSSDEPRELHRQHDFGDQIAGFRAENMGAQHLVGLGVGQDFHQAVGGGDGLGAGIGGEGKLADLVGDAGRLQFFFGFADGGDFREV